MRKTAIAVSLAFAFLLAVFFGNRLGVSCYRRWQATKLLAVVRQFHPGTTTETEARTALRPFARYEKKTGVNDLGFAFENSPPLPWTRFSIDIKFVGGLVSELHLTEMQVDHSGIPSSKLCICHDIFQPAPSASCRFQRLLRVLSKYRRHRLARKLDWLSMLPRSIHQTGRASYTISDVRVSQLQAILHDIFCAMQG